MFGYFLLHPNLDRDLSSVMLAESLLSKASGNSDLRIVIIKTEFLAE